jgi:hypothetical protein
VGELVWCEEGGGWGTLVVEIESGLFGCVQFHVLGWNVEWALEKGTCDGKNMGAMLYRYRHTSKEK